MPAAAGGGGGGAPERDRGEEESRLWKRAGATGGRSTSRPEGEGSPCSVSLANEREKRAGGEILYEEPRPPGFQGGGTLQHFREGGGGLNLAPLVYSLLC